MTFEVYFKVSKTDSLADSIRLENVEIVKTNLNGSMIFFYNFDRQVVAQMHTDYICNIVPILSVKIPAESTNDAAYNALVKHCADIVPTPPVEAMETKGGSTGNYNQIPDGRNLKSDPADR